MTGGGKFRQGKLVTAGHSTRVEGFDEFHRRVLNTWPEITQVRIGTLQHRNRVGRQSKRMKVAPSSENGLAPAQQHKRARGGGGFSFRATRWAMVGDKITGIKCDATYGTTIQEVVLVGPDLERLKWRLQQEGYGATW